jgi:hypothetical protein
MRPPLPRRSGDRHFDSARQSDKVPATRVEGRIGAEHSTTVRRPPALAAARRIPYISFSNLAERP